jgi:hypothetical protein
MNDAAYLIMLWGELYHVRWNFVKGWTHTPSNSNFGFQPVSSDDCISRPWSMNSIK